MARKRKNRRKSRGNRHALYGVQKSTNYMQTAKDGALVLLSAIAGSGVGAAIGKHSLLAGIPITIVGLYKQNKYIMSAGLGLTLSNGFQRQGQTATTQGVDGFDMKQIAAEAKDRVGTFFQNFSEKLYLSKPKMTEGVEGLGQDQVTYFINPYSNKELDMSAIDRVQEQIAEMNKNVNGLNEIEREF